jgi:preprotein translocase subunit SecD
VAPPAGHIRPGRYLAFFLLIVVILYGLVFATGDHKPTPKLGIDLQGGTRVTLTARTEDGSEPSRESLDLARQIITDRVNGIGVSGAEVILDGNQIVITVPGEGGEQAKSLGQTAQLRFRPVVLEEPAAPPPAPTETSQPPPTSANPPASGATQPPAGTQSSPPPQGRPAPAAQPASQPGAQQGGQPPSSPPPTAPTAPPPATTSPPAPPPEDGSVDPQVAEEIRRAKAVRQNPQLVPSADGTVQADPAAQQAALAAVDCSPNANDPLAGNDDPKLPLATCDRDGNFKYILAPSIIEGTEISDANANVDPQGVGYIVSLTFESSGSRTWGEFTTGNVGKQCAFVLDTEVVSAPRINEPITGGDTQISGGEGGFRQQEAQDLANVLKYGSLPLSFESSEAETVSATLGAASLRAALIAGALGLAVVFVYCLFYYRLLGVLMILSLALSGAIVFSVLILLGRAIGFTLDLAGIAGFIVAIGITADSFVVFFERLKDEVREGRTFRSSVPRAWIRARRTILSADAVQFIAAVVLYLLAVGQVKGFAFTLGMSTVLDLIVVFLVTHPLVVYASKWKFMATHNLSGLGAMQRIAAAQRSAARPATKEA